MSPTVKRVDATERRTEVLPPRGGHQVGPDRCKGILAFARPGRKAKTGIERRVHSSGPVPLRAGQRIRTPRVVDRSVV
jgi:hypothetical protein